MTNSPMPLLRIDQVAKSFGKTRAVDGVSLDIHENEFFALLGPSGCGKTTLLRMLAGFEALDSGQILLSGKDISPLPPEKRPLNLMFQSYALFPHMTVRQNLNYGLEMERLPRKVIRTRVDETLASTDLTALADRKPDQLSGGQKQRVALARALVKRPKVLLLDEPLGALDKKLRERMQLELKRLQHEAGITFIIVTHDQEEALVMADRMAILKDGKLLQAGTPEEIYEEPADRFVANFIGIMNFLDGEIDGTHAFVVDGSRHPIAVRHGPRKATLAVRPEHVRITERADGLGVVITDVAYHGLDRVLHTKTVASGKPLQLRLSAAEGQRYAAGQTIMIALDAAKCRIY
ncbi:ABC transporter ATP-binding protein [Rhizobium sp. LjRoot254]|uniref:ABC transporter ATP-binding protein n=1 Tax=Rhizobium sp. LjRoot254 TaxID=3342297 RepID=UPI003ED11FB1